jgi:uncharacterized membrane protein
MNDMRSADEKSGQMAGKAKMVSSRLYMLLISGFVLIFVGILIVLIATMLHNNGSASGGVVVFIGPFPIVIGAGSDVSVIITFSVILAVLSIVLFFVVNRKMRSLDD